MTWKLAAPKGNRGDEIADLLDQTTSAMKDKIVRYRSARRAAKFNRSIHVMFHQAKDESIQTIPSVVLVTEMFEVYQDTDVDAVLKTCSEQLQNRIVAFEGLGSGWVLETLEEMDTTIWTLDPLRAETYHPHSRWISSTRCVVNVRNEDNECFRHAVMAGLYTPEQNGHRVSSYKPYYEQEDAPMFQLTYPAKLRDIAKFERDNEAKDISVHVYGVEERRGRKVFVAPECEDEQAVVSISTMSEGESESESDEEMEEDRQF